jgi:hypothetical protein
MNLKCCSVSVLDIRKIRSDSIWPVIGLNIQGDSNIRKFGKATFLFDSLPV